MAIKKLTVKQARRACPPNRFTFGTTAELPAATDIFGQPRATRAIDFGIDVGGPGFNIFVLGPGGSGRATTIERFLSDKATRGKVPDDWVYVHNFVDPYKPRAMRLPPGRANAFRQDMQSLVGHLETDVPRAFESEEYHQARARVSRELDEKQQAAYHELESAAAQRNYAIVRTPGGLLIAPLVDGKPAPIEALAGLPPDQRQQMEQTGMDLQQILADSVRKVRIYEKEAQEAVAELDRQVAANVAGHVVDALIERYQADCPEVAEYLEEVRRDIIDHIGEFSPNQQQQPQPPDPLRGPSARLRYQVNVLVDHARTVGAPVVNERNPSFMNLIGRIERDVRFGGTVMDFTMLRSGALHRANGGYLVLRAKDVLNDPIGWAALKRALDSGQVQIDDPGTQFQMFSTRTLEPEPIPLDVKVIMLGSPSLYYFLYAVDEDFQKLFKVKADFAPEMDRTPENEHAYAMFIRARCDEESLRPLDRGAVAYVVEYGSWLAEDQDKLSTRFGEVANVVREASYWAGKAGRDVVTLGDVSTAIREARQRADQIEQQSRRLILDGTITIATQGAIVGQINGLSVRIAGDHAFALPSRISARTYLGRAGVINIEREVKLSGRIHDKGVLILQGYLGSQYAVERPLTLSASLVFEQSYSDVDGDSASSTELYALLSSLSGLPIRQDIAVTGSVDQHGRVQAIGGVTHKVEGFFDLCHERGLTGEQGVMIPATNVKNLMLREDVVQAIDKGRFHIWAVSTVDEGIELLTGVKAGKRGAKGKFPPDSVHGRVEARLKEIAERMEKAGKSAEDKGNSKSSHEPNGDRSDAPKRRRKTKC
ncbi:MAG TPA: ATP-binding protein [Anaerolineae bacterium]|nr:ATP-binding protein [Anaerolineae bacterium]